MAVFVDLDDAEVEPPQQDGKPIWQPMLEQRFSVGVLQDDSAQSSRQEKERVEEPPLANTAEHSDQGRNRLAEALRCYPVAMAVAGHLDLNTLDNLSRTCRAVHHALLQFRRMLLISTLRCVNEDLEVDTDDVIRYRARISTSYSVSYPQGPAGQGMDNRRQHWVKAGQCARDLVSDCRRCGRVVCRNCAIKPPTPVVLRNRHRRLCKACGRAPLGLLAKPRLPPETTLNSETMQRHVCKCDSAEGIWLCQPCGRNLRSDDDGYKCIWRWRNQYGEILGGIGTGIGEADRGVVCGRESLCLAATKRETETDCDAEDLREAADASGSEVGSFGSSSSSRGSLFAPAENELSRTPSPGSRGPGYARHEIEGIGGVVKKKLVRMVKVGACVPEYEDEKARNDIMGREINGKVRSWCGWCWRVIPGPRDHDIAREEAEDRRWKEKEEALS